MDRLVICLTCLLCCIPPFALALELGAIDVRSARFEPLDARIPLVDIRGGDFGGLAAALATPDQFKAACEAKSNIHDLLEFSVVPQDEGAGYVQVRTVEPIFEQSLTLVVEVGWPRERKVRVFSFDLVPAAGPAAQSSVRTGTTRDLESWTADSRAVPRSPPLDAERAVYGPVRRTDTLWSIATDARPDDSVSIHRMMLAILEANPDAFPTGNVNVLHAGGFLRIPTRADLDSGVLSAIAEVRRQQAQWEQRTASRLASPAPTTVAPERPNAESEPGGRIEIVSAETTGDGAPQDGDAVVRALRRDLALARGVRRLPAWI